VLITKGAITVLDVDVSGLTIPLSLGEGEQDALFLAFQLNKSLFGTDDGKAIKAARFLGVPFVISPKIVVELYRLERVSFKKARESLEKLAVIGRYSPEIIADALARIMEEKDDPTHDHKDTGKPPE
jgi:predicted nucleic acid-binding protein